MAMQRQLWTVNGVAVELGMDRRTVASALDGVGPDGARSGFPAWYMETAVNAIAKRTNGRKRPCRRASRDPVLEMMADRIQNWREVHQHGEAIHATVSEAAAWFEVSTGDVLNWLRAGMPYFVRGDFSSGDGFVLNSAWTIDWVVMTSHLVQETADSDVLRILGLPRASV